MFGLFYALGTAVAGAVSGTKCLIQNANGIAEGIEKYKRGENPTETYHDRKGFLRDLHTGEFAGVTTNYKTLDNDEWLYVGSVTNRTRNLSEEKRQKEFELGKQGSWLGRTVDLYDERYWSIQMGKSDKTDIVGAFYKDLLTGDMYVCRGFTIGSKLVPGYDLEISKSCKFYMNIKNGELVRKSDTQIEEEKECPQFARFQMTDEEANEFIKNFNEQQRNGGWVKSRERYCSFLRTDKQKFYCNDYNVNDHIRKLYELQNRQ